VEWARNVPSNFGQDKPTQQNLAAIKAPEDILFMLQECSPPLPTTDLEVVKVEEHEEDFNQAIKVLSKESVSPIETA